MRGEKAGRFGQAPWLVWAAEGLLAVPILAVLFLVLIRQTALLDSDYFWHLATGHLILQAGFPESETFSWTYAGRPWRPHDWLTDVLLGWLYRGLGHAGPVAVTAVLGVVTLAIVHVRARLLGAGHVAALVFVAAGAVALAPLVAVRPLVLLWLGVTIAALLVERVLLTGTSAPLLVMPLLAAVGANLHRGTPPIIAALAGLGAVQLVWQAGRQVRRAPTDTPRWLRRALILLLAGGLVVGAGVLTPAGPEGLIRSFVIVSNPALRVLIEEWRSPDFQRPELRPFAVLLLAGLVVFGRWGPRRAELWPYALLLVVGTAAAALDSARHLALYVLLAGPWIAAAPPLPKTAPLRLRPLPGLLFGVTGLLLVGVGLASASAANLEAREARVYPRAAVDWLQEQGQAPRLFHEYDWGGYLIWRGVPVFVDGRAEVLYEAAFLFRVQETLTAGPGWRDLILRDYPVDGVLLRPDAPLVGALRVEGWATCWQDQVAVVLRPRCP